MKQTFNKILLGDIARSKWEQNNVGSNPQENPLQSEEELYSLIATGMKDFLWRSVLHFGAISLLLRVLRWSITEACMGWQRLSITQRSFFSILLSDTSRFSSLTPRIEPAFQISLFSLLASAVFTPLPQHTAAKNAFNHSVIEHGQHFPTNIEEPEPPHQEKPTLPFFEDSSCRGPESVDPVVDFQVLIIILCFRFILVGNFLFSGFVSVLYFKLLLFCVPVPALVPRLYVPSLSPCLVLSSCLCKPVVFPVLFLRSPSHVSVLSFTSVSRRP